MDTTMTVKNQIGPQFLCPRHLRPRPPLTHGTARVEGRQLVPPQTSRCPVLPGPPMVRNPGARLNGKERETPVKVLEKADRRLIPARGKEPKTGNRVPFPPLTHGIARVEGRQAVTRRRPLLSRQQRPVALETRDLIPDGLPSTGRPRKLHMRLICRNHRRRC